MTPEYETIQIPDPEEELKFVDADIADACRKMGGYLIGTPTQMQLCRNLKFLTEAIASKIKE